MNQLTLLRLATATGLVALSLGAFVGGQDTDLPGPSAPTPELMKVPASFHVQAPRVGLHEPVRVQGSDTSLVACVVHHAIEGDRVLAFPTEGTRFHEALPVHRKPGQVLDLVGAINAGNQPQLFWTELLEQRAVLMTSWLVDGAFTEPAPLQGAGSPSSAASCRRLTDGSLWIAWQEYRRAADQTRGSYDVRVGRVAGAALESVLDVAAGPDDARDPALTEGEDGTLWVVYTHSDRLDAEIHARPVNLHSGQAGEPVNVSDDPLADDFHASADGDGQGGLWIAWDRLRDPRRGESDKDIVDIQVSLQLAHVGGDGVTVLADAAGRPLPVPGPDSLTRSGGHPVVRCDARGRLHLVYRYLRVDQEILFPVVYQTCDGAWSEPLEIEHSGGDAMPVSVQVGPDHLWIDAQAYYREQTVTAVDMPWKPRVVRSVDLMEAGRGLTTRGRELIGGLRLPLPTGGNPASLPRVTRPRSARPARTSPLGDIEGDAILSGRDHYRVRDGDREYRVYWGDLHRHTHMSHCTNGNEPGPRVSYDLGRDFHGYDFVALTDHANHLAPRQWWYQGKLLDLYRTDDFCPLQGYEWAHPDSGHVNVILRDRSDRILPRRGSQKTLFEFLKRDAAITIPHHTAHRDMAFDWSADDPHFLRLVEVFQACRGSYEFQGSFRGSRSATAAGGFVQDALTMGRRIGIIASSDHGNGTSYTAVLAEALNQEDLFQALQARRAYGSTTKGMFVDFRINDRLMGREVRTSQPPRVDVHVIGIEELAEVVVFRNGEVWQSSGRPDTYLDREQIIPLEIEPGRRFRAETDLEFRLAVDDGVFVEAVKRDARAMQAAWRPVARRRSAVWRCPEGTEGPFLDNARRIILHASPLATLTLTRGEDRTEILLADLFEKPVRLTGRAATSLKLNAVGSDDFRIDPSRGLGSKEFQATWTDDDIPEGASWYYVRAIQTDSEMVWSSPIFVNHGGQ